jgi:ankyrin repeat protein
MALALAAQHGHAAVVRLLLDAGEDPSRYNPYRYHSHSTPLHQAVWAGYMEVVQLLVERGARLDVQDTVYGGTPLDWAAYSDRYDRWEIADYLRDRGGPSSWVREWPEEAGAVSHESEPEALSPPARRPRRRPLPPATA